MASSSVPVLQRRLGVRVNGVIGPEMEPAIREYQRTHGLLESGVLDHKTRRRLEMVDGLVPFWFGTAAHDDSVRRLIGDPDAVRRYQSSLGLDPTGDVDETTARTLGD